MAKEKRQAFNARVADISESSHRMKLLAVESQFDAQTGAFLTDDAARYGALQAAVSQEPMFESVSEEHAISIVTAMQSAVREHEKTYGELPRDEVFASAYSTMKNMMMLEGRSSEGSVGEMMLESIGESLSTSEGVEIRARMVGLVMPVLLNTATLDAVTLIPAGANEAEIFKIYRRAGTSFADFKKGDIINASTVGQYSSMKQRYAFVEAQQPDAAMASHVFKTETDLANTAIEIPFKKGSVSVWMNRKRICRDLGSNNGIMTGVFTDAEGVSYTVNATVDYTAGIVTVTPTAVLPAGVELHAEFEVDIESKPELIPTIDHDMDSVLLRPSQNAIAADATIQAMFTMQREFGADLKSMQMGHMRNVLSAEKSVRHLRDMDFVCTREETFNLYVPEGEDWKLHREKLREVLLGISRKILAATEVVGLTGLYAGTNASNMLKALGAPHFISPANYVQTNDIHYAGKLFNLWKVFEAPVVIGADEILCYGRGASHSEAGYVAGDAIAATMYNHPIGATLRARNTLYELAYGEVHPYGGENFFYRLKLTNVAPE